MLIRPISFYDEIQNDFTIVYPIRYHDTYDIFGFNTLCNQTNCPLCNINESIKTNIYMYAKYMRKGVDLEKVNKKLENIHKPTERYLIPTIIINGKYFNIKVKYFTYKSVFRLLKYLENIGDDKLEMVIESGQYFISDELYFIDLNELKIHKIYKIDYRIPKGFKSKLKEISEFKKNYIDKYFRFDENFLKFFLDSNF